MTELQVFPRCLEEMAIPKARLNQGYKKFWAEFIKQIVTYGFSWHAV